MIRAVSALLVHMPLQKSVQLPGLKLQHIEFVVVIIEEGHTSGVGAFTVIPGFSAVTMDQLWRFARRKGGDIVGEDARWSLNHMRMESGRSLMWATPFTVALEALSGLIPRPEVLECPLAGPVCEQKEPNISVEVIGLLKQGFQILSVEGGIDVESDIRRVKRIQSLAGHSARVRLDCHEGYSFHDARRFIETVDTAALELLEQPFPRDEWEQTAAFAEWSPVPVMLHESIWGEGDLEQAARMGCCQYVKCSLGRAYSLEGLIRHVQRAQELALQVAVGSDVGCEIQCYYEALVAAFLGVGTAGDMHGFFLQQEQLLEKPLSVRKGKIVLPTDGVPDLNHEKLEGYIVKRLKWASSEDFQPPAAKRKPQKILAKTKRS
jgi:O-succinylbenzoate synthase